MAVKPALWSAAGLALAASLMVSAPAAAHPHVFIDYTVTVLCGDAGITGVRLSWTFDEMYSSMLFHDYTSRPQGALTGGFQREVNFTCEAAKILPAMSSPESPA